MNGTAPWSAVVVGCGKIGSVFSFDGGRNPTRDASGPILSHCEAFRRNPRFHLVAVVESDPSRRAEASRGWGVPGFTSFGEVSERADVVSVCVPEEVQCVVALEILERNAPKVLFMEKPFTTRSSDAEAVIALAERKGTEIVLNYSRRFDDAHVRMKEAIAKGEFGDPLSGRLLYGKGLLHNGSHAIDLIRFWFGDPKSVRKDGTKWGPTGDPTDGAVLDFGAWEIRLEPFDERIATVFECDFFFEKKRIRVVGGGVAWSISERAEDPLYPGYRIYTESPAIARSDAMTGCFPTALAQIDELLTHGKTTACTARDGLAVHRWVERIRSGGVGVRIAPS